MTEIRIEGHVRDAGDLGLGTKEGSGKQIGVVIETDNGDVTVTGFGKAAARDLAKHVFQPVTLVLTVGKDGGK